KPPAGCKAQPGGWMLRQWRNSRAAPIAFKTPRTAFSRRIARDPGQAIPQARGLRRLRRLGREFRVRVLELRPDPGPEHLNFLRRPAFAGVFGYAEAFRDRILIIDTR